MIRIVRIRISFIQNRLPEELGWARTRNSVNSNGNACTSVHPAHFAGSILYVGETLPNNSNKCVPSNRSRVACPFFQLSIVVWRSSQSSYLYCSGPNITSATNTKQHVNTPTNVITRASTILQVNNWWTGYARVTKRFFFIFSGLIEGSGAV